MALVPVLVPDPLVYVETAAGFAEALVDAAVGHIVVVAHLDLTGLPPVDTESLAIARPLPSLKSIRGECAPVPQALAMTLPDDAIIADGACVIRVLHAWLDMNAAANQEDHTLWVSRFVVQAARPAEDQQAAPLLSITGGAAWLAGLLLVGDGFEGRGVGITSGNVYIGDSHFSGFRSFAGSAVWCSGGGSAVSLARCRFSSNAASARFGAAVLADSGDVLIANCTFAANGENDVAVQGGAVWTTDAAAAAVNVYDSRTRVVTTAAQFGEEAVLAPESVFIYDDYLTPAGAPLAAGAPAAAGTEAVEMPGFLSEDDPGITAIRRDQEAAEEQYVPELPRLDASAAPDELGAEDFGQSLAPQPRRIAAHLTLVIVAAALLLR